MVGIRARSLAGCLGLAVAGVVSTPRAVLAQSADTATAESLFEQGRDLLRAGKASEACPKLAESQRIEPSTGTLLALAMCHEADGKLASAWAEFVSVEARARGENRVDRQQAARDKAQALRPRLSTLEIRIPNDIAALPGLEIRRDGEVLGRGAWNVAVPIDGAEHTVEAHATGKTTWKGSITVKAESDVAVLAVPPLADAPVELQASGNGAAEKPGIGQTQRADTASSRWGALEWAGVTAAGAGVVALGFGGYLLSSALGKKSDSTSDCSGNACGSQGFADRTSAVSKGNTATIFAVTGGALVAGGVTLFMVGRTRAHRGENGAAPGGLALGAGPAGLGAQFLTRF
jgi:hypothetical protein